MTVDENVYPRKSGNFIEMSSWYDIDLDRIKTPANILGWIDHLSSKPWVTRAMIKTFISFAAGHLKIKIHPF